VLGFVLDLLPPFLAGRTQIIDPAFGLAAFFPQIMEPVLVLLPGFCLEAILLLFAD